MIPFHTQLKQINRNKLILLKHEIMFFKKTQFKLQTSDLKHGYTNHKHLTKQTTPPHTHTQYHNTKHPPTLVLFSSPKTHKHSHITQTTTLPHPEAVPR